MAATKKPKTAPTTPWPATPETLHTDGDWIWIPLKSEWRDSTGKPEELVRQKFVRHLCENYGYSLDQMRQEQRMISGSRSVDGRESQARSFAKICGVLGSEKVGR